MKRQFELGFKKEWNSLLGFLDDLEVKEAVSGSSDATKFVMAYIGNNGGIKVRGVHL